jgi:hypothetical protein
MQSGAVNNTGQLQASGYGLVPAAEEAAMVPGLSVTSHSFRLSTGPLSLDFSWRREDRPSLAGCRESEAASTGRQARPSRPLQSFSEVLRRQQLASLLMPPCKAPQERQRLDFSTPRLPTQAGEACRAYQNAAQLSFMMRQHFAA